jgi:hypothetical protein
MPGWRRGPTRWGEIVGASVHARGNPVSPSGLEAFLLA